MYMLCYIVLLLLYHIFTMIIIYFTIHKISNYANCPDIMNTLHNKKIIGPKDKPCSMPQYFVIM